MDDFDLHCLVKYGEMNYLVLTPAAVQQIRQAWQEQYGTIDEPQQDLACTFEKICIIECTFLENSFKLFIELISQYTPKIVRKIWMADCDFTVLVDDFRTIMLASFQTKRLESFELEWDNRAINLLDVFDWSLVEQLTSIADKVDVKLDGFQLTADATHRPIKLECRATLRHIRFPRFFQIALQTKALSEFDLWCHEEWVKNDWALFASFVVRLPHPTLRTIRIDDFFVTDERKDNLMFLRKALVENRTLECIQLGWFDGSVAILLEEVVIPVLQEDDTSLQRPPMKLALKYGKWLSDAIVESMKTLIYHLPTMGRLCALEVPFRPCLVADWLATLRTHDTLRSLVFQDEEEIEGDEAAPVMSLVRRNHLLYKARQFTVVFSETTRYDIAAMVAIWSRFAAFPKEDTRRQEWLSASYYLLQTCYLEKIRFSSNNSLGLGK